MGQARRRASPPRRRGSPVGTLVAVGAVGLVAFGAPATELAAEVTASWSSFRNAGTAVPDTPRVAPPPAGAVQPRVPEPILDTPVLALPEPGPIEVEVPSPLVPRGVPLEYTPPPSPCGGHGSPRRIPPAVDLGPGSATLSWMADSRTDVRGYRVQAVSQQLVAGNQPDPPQQLVPQRDDCGAVTVTMTELDSGVPYVFWLEQQIWDADAEVMRYVQVGTSAAVVIP